MINNIKKFNGHEFKKSLGQNFISDSNLLKSICNDAGITKEDLVLEIGAGGGTLTNYICKNAKKVVSLEVDRSLETLLNEVVAQNSNLNVVYADIMKINLDVIDDYFKEKVISYKVVANLPYYITTPIIFKLFSDNLRLTSITIMVQKEVAERMVATTGTENYGVLSVMVQYFGEAKIKRIVKKTNFYPMPKVDSAIVRIDLYKNIDKNFSTHFEKVVKCAFQNRRKKLTSNLSGGLAVCKDDCIKALESLGYNQNVRAEELSSNDFVKLTKLLLNN
ncbi:MAG: 16S rRNA (adenine(1518)-N(6)/adenine(1519)-N(6))-dimethyltransferase RsmA [Christensenellales bacterium]